MQFSSLVVLLMLSSFTAYSDDSSVEVTPQGLEFKKMAEVSVESEDLLISLTRIEVSMTFFNSSDKDFSTLIAFPIPEYSYRGDQGIPDFRDFTVEVNGVPVQYQTEIRAFHNGKDCTKLLEEMHISIQDFGNSFEDFASGTNARYFSQLSPENQAILLKDGLVDSTDKIPIWSVQIKYYWTQTFPSKQPVTIRHRYKPLCGGTQFTFEKPDDLAFLKIDACLGKRKLQTLQLHSKESPIIGSWVSYVLKTALNWKRPIKKLHLVIEKADNEIIASCFLRYLKLTRQNIYEGTMVNFVPNADIKVYFFPFAR